VHAQWTQRLQREPQKHVDALDQALASLTGKKLPAGVLAESLSHVVFTDDPLPATFQTMGQWSYDLGFASKAPELAGLFDVKTPAATQP
jgi:hypothetical protein